MEFSADFFSLRFFGVGPWAGHPWGHRRVLTDAPRTLTAPTQGRKGHGLEAWRWGKHPAKETRLLTRHLQEVWFLGHACHTLATSLFTSLFAGKREVPHVGASFGVLPPTPLVQRTFQKRVAAPCSYLGPAGGPTALPTGSATRIITYSKRFPIGGRGGGPTARHGSRHAIWTPRAGCATNQTSNQTSARSLVSWPCLPRFGHFPFHFPFRGEKGSAPPGWGRAASAHTLECHPRCSLRFVWGAWEADGSAPKRKR